MPPGALFAAAVVLLALLGLTAAQPRPSTPPDGLGQAQLSVTPEPPHADRSARQLTLRWARLVTTWTTRNYAERLRSLAALAAPSLRRRLRQTEPPPLDGRQLTSTGRVITVAVRGVGHRRAVVVLVRVSLRGAGQLVTRYEVYAGTVVADTSGHWRMQAWRREP